MVCSSIIYIIMSYISKPSAVTMYVFLRTPAGMNQLKLSLTVFQMK